VRPDLVAILPRIPDLQANGVASMFKTVGKAQLLLAAIAMSACSYGALAPDGAEPMDATADEVAEFETLAFGEGGEDNVSGDCNCLGTRPTLTGDWCGYRTCLQQSGVTFAGRSTHFAFGIDGGIDSPSASALLPLGRVIRSSTPVVASTT
jgi:hypothetical protein